MSELADPLTTARRWITSSSTRDFAFFVMDADGGAPSSSPMIRRDGTSVACGVPHRSCAHGGSQARPLHLNVLS